MTDYARNFIAGAWVAASGQTTTVIDPTYAKPCGTVRHASLPEVAQAAEAARAAFPAWCTTPVEERAAKLETLMAALAVRTDAFIDGMAGEVGVPVWFGRLLRVPMPLKNGAAAIASLREMTWSERLRSSLVTRVPCGVVAAITPWNAPLHQIVGKVVAALAAGCTVVLKPSEIAPSTAHLFAEAVNEAALPAGSFNLVWGDAAVGAALVRHREGDVVSFTGSEWGGARVAEAAGSEIKRVVLELGGKSAAILLDDAPMEKAVTTVLTQCFANTGQTCVAQSRLLVPRGRLREVEQLCADGASAWTPGDPRDEATRMGPVASEAQKRAVTALIEGALRDGARRVAGDTAPPPSLPSGFFVQPTVFSDVAPDSTLAQEEVFGPVLSVIPYDSEDEAVRIANGTRFGLSGSVWGDDLSRATGVAALLETGQVGLNGAPQNFLAPFGGFKRSGFGRENGRFGVEEFLQFRTIHGAA